MTELLTKVGQIRSKKLENVSKTLLGSKKSKRRLLITILLILHKKKSVMSIRLCVSTIIKKATMPVPALNF